MLALRLVPRRLKSIAKPPPWKSNGRTYSFNWPTLAQTGVRLGTAALNCSETLLDLDQQRRVSATFKYCATGETLRSWDLSGVNCLPDPVNRQQMISSASHRRQINVTGELAHGRENAFHDKAQSRDVATLRLFNQDARQFFGVPVQ
jgi:hypothetical protein